MKSNARNKLLFPALLFVATLAGCGPTHVNQEQEQTDEEEKEELPERDLIDEPPGL